MCACMLLHVVCVDKFSFWPPVNKTFQIGHLGSAAYCCVDHCAQVERSHDEGPLYLEVERKLRQVVG